MKRRRQPTTPDALAEQLRDVRVIGKGPRSRVLVGTDPTTGMPIVVREIQTSGLDSAATRSYLGRSDALIAAASHPNIVGLYATFEGSDGSLVHLEQYCPGSCDFLYRSGSRLAVDQIVAVGLRTAEALSWLHERNILHLGIGLRDLRFADEATPCLANVGMSLLFSPAQRLADTDPTPLNRPIPPEAIRGEPTGPASDLYCLAFALHELITGEPPIAPLTGESPAARGIRILGLRPVPLVATGVPHALALLLAESLAPDPDDRPQSAVEFASRLHEASKSLDQAWTGRLTIPEPTGVLAAHDTVVLWKPQ